MSEEKPPDEKPPIEPIAENFSIEDFFRPGWETLETKTTFLSPYFQHMKQKGFLMREVRGEANHRMKVVVPGTDAEREVLMFGSNNYLGLAAEPEIKERMIQTIRDFGIGCGGPPLLNGTTTLHRELERRLAKMKQADDVLIYASGYQANVGWCSALLGRRDVLVYDSLSHASLFDGIALGSFESIAFSHNNMADLNKRLMEVRYRSPYRNVIVGVEGVYSMDGDLAPLPEVRALCDKYGALLCVDDAHGTGVMGAKGHGTSEHFEMDGKVDLTMGTFSKVFAVTGGFVAGRQELIDYLRIFSRSYMFSASLPTPVVGAILGGLDFLEAHPERITQLHANAQYMLKGLKEQGFECSCRTAILPVMVPPSVPIYDMITRLHEEGLFVNGITYPAVPKHLQRLRLSMMATMSTEDLDYAIEKLGAVAREFGMLS